MICRFELFEEKTKKAPRKAVDGDDTVTVKRTVKPAPEVIMYASGTLHRQDNRVKVALNDGRTYTMLACDLSTLADLLGGDDAYSCSGEKVTRCGVLALTKEGRSVRVDLGSVYGMARRAAAHLACLERFDEPSP